MAIRYSDMGLDTIGARDFVARQRTPTPAQIGIILTSAFLIGVSLVASIHTPMMLVTTLFALFSIIGWYVIFQLMRSRDMLLATEFQNALFAAAMGLHNKFCIIIKSNGSIVYLDRSFQGLFPDFINQSNRSVDNLLRIGKVGAADCERVSIAIEKGTYEKVIFDITDAHGLLHRVILSVEPIMRPAGFIMLRGREFIEERQNQNINLGGSPVISKSSVTLFSHVMESMKMGVYITSPKGTIVFCNPLLEQWLHYSEGETMARNLSLHNIIPAIRNKNMSDEPADFEGVVQMEKKIGGFIKVFLNQKIIYNDAGQIMGCTALVHHYNDEQGDDSHNAGF
jgi:two-component system cell cycle sensor histidine kinase/response regulator CckA